MITFVVEEQAQGTLLPERCCFRGTVQDWITFAPALRGPLINTLSTLPAREACLISRHFENQHIHRFPASQESKAELVEDGFLKWVGLPGYIASANFNSKP